MNDNTQTPHAVFAYVHHDRRLGALITLRCQTDFALRTDLIQELGHKLAMHAAACGSVQMDAPWTFDSSTTVSTVLARAAAKLGEKVELHAVQVHA